MMNNNENQKKSILNKFISFLKRLFTRKNNNNLLVEGQITEKTKDSYVETKNLKEQITILRDIERERLLNLREQWENGEKEEEEIAEEDIDKLIEIYNAETEKIEQETEQIKQDIAKMLKELKESA